MKREMVRRLRGAAPTLLLAAGCAKILGFDESMPVPCVSSSDCAAGFVCLRETCQCDGECPSGGTAGQGGSQTAGEAGGGSPSAGKGSTTGGAAGTDATGGTGGSVTGGAAGEGGESASGGAGNAPSAGGASGSAGESVGGAGDGGAAGSGPTSECGNEAESCLVCDEAGKHLPGETPCEVACQGSGECVWPPSCDALGGPICAGENCCVSLPVLGADFRRSCDYACAVNCIELNTTLNFPAAVSSFGLDVFEVTVGRFRAFVTQYSAPAAGSGRNLRNSADAGWNPDWDEFLASDESALRAALQDPEACDGPLMWTDTVPPYPPNHEDRPMNCVTWFEAQAFCIWDGGRLPTEAEWNFAAAGGEENRYYPWSQPADSTEIDESNAIFKYDSDPPLEPAPVGSRVGGQSRWQHMDLGGNVAEWVWDGYRACYNPPRDCVDCGEAPTGSSRVVRGGAFHNVADDVSVETRREIDSTGRRPWLGFRCSRDL